MGKVIQKTKHKYFNSKIYDEKNYLENCNKLIRD